MRLQQLFPLDNPATLRSVESKLAELGIDPATQGDAVVGAARVILADLPVDLAGMDKAAEEALGAPPEVLQALTDLGHLGAATELALFALFRLAVGGAPTVAELDKATVPVAVAIVRFGIAKLSEINKSTQDESSSGTNEETPTWSEFVSQSEEARRERADTANPFTAITASRDPAKPNPFMSSLVNVDLLSIAESLQRILRDTGSNAAGISAAPIGVEAVIPFILRHINLFDLSLGQGDGNNDAFVHAPSVVAYAGLGLPGLRQIAAARARRGEAYFGSLLNLNNYDLVDIVLEARRTSGYPVGLLRMNFAKTQWVMVNNKVKHVPGWYMALLALHVLKYCRASITCDKFTIHVIHKIRCPVIIVPTGAETLPLSSALNRGLTSTVIETLDIVRSQTISGLAAVVNRLTTTIRPADLPTFEEVPFSILLPNQMRPSHLPSTSSFIEIDLAAHGAKAVNLTTGKVSDITIEREALLRWRLPLMESATGYNPRVAASNLAALPPSIMPSIPAEALLTRVARHCIRMVNNVDITNSMAEAIAVILVANLVRERVAGSPIGILLEQEFAGFFVCSAEIGERESSGQGKTTIARLLAQMMTPGIREIVMSRQSGTVAQRASAMQLMKSGTLLLDEFKIPEVTADQHWAGREGMQSLLTGGGVCVGEVGQNRGESRLRIAPVFCGKYFHVPHDIALRLVPIPIGHRTAETETPEPERSCLMSGALATIYRLAMLLFIEKNDIIERIRSAHPGITDLRFRFPGHLGIYEVVFGHPAKEEFFADIDALRNHALAIRDQARLTGALASNKQGPTFDPQFFFSEAPESRIKELFARSNDGLVSLREFLVAITADGTGVMADQHREYRTQLRNANVSESEAHATLCEMAAKPMEHPSKWTAQVAIERDLSRHRVTKRIRLQPPPGYQNPNYPRKGAQATDGTAGRQVNHG